MLFDFRFPLAEMLIPRRCLACDQNVADGIICDPCWSLCNRHPNFLFASNQNQVGALFYYELVIKDLIKQVKFSQNTSSLHLLLHIINRQIIESNTLNTLISFSPDAITFVPTHWARILLRGLDLTSLFAYALGKHLNKPVVALLSKNYFNRVQSKLTSRADRKTAVQKLFSLRPNCPSFSRILLVDDIVTSGATLKEAKRLLKLKTKRVSCIAIAKTPL